MTAEDFRAWLAAMNATPIAAAAMLGVDESEVAAFLQSGGPRMLLLACERLSQIGQPTLTSKPDRAAEVLRRREAGERFTDIATSIGVTPTAVRLMYLRAKERAAKLGLTSP